ncbi:hypothetical protein CRH09_37485 [Nocardia terpenica]|uniref:Uncharacterized protein n=1 Tax=Nocardia terpenica TaxID=455432 RepID=A0A291RU09_9NOCA|nr:hypothetical protein CRH09_37485 [Nocardia terpenica]
MGHADRDRDRDVRLAGGEADQFRGAQGQARIALELRAGVVRENLFHHGLFRVGVHGFEVAADGLRRRLGRAPGGGDGRGGGGRGRRRGYGGGGCRGGGSGGGTGRGVLT